MNFIQSPNLPESDTALVAVSGTYAIVIDALLDLGIDVIQLKPCKELSKPVSSHADMLIHHLGGNRIVVANGQTYLIKELQRYGFEAVQSNIRISENYPHDIALNAARIGNRLLANKAALDGVISRYCTQNQIATIAVKQGYAKCSTVVVDKNSIITADESIAKAAAAAEVDVLMITPGHVKLAGYEYGFLGGTCGLIGKNKLAFCGCVKTHPDYEKIKSFCESKHVELISLFDGPLLDIGGILPLKIKTDNRKEET